MEKIYSSQKEAVKYEYDEALRYEELEDFWQTYGPWADVMFILSTICVCTGVMMCYGKFKMNLRKYESSPCNPANGQNI